MSISFRFRWLLVVLAVAWLFAVVFAYYVVHKPFAVENGLALLSAILDVITIGVILALATAVGHRLLRALSFASSSEALIFEAGVGMGLISLGTLALGLAGLVSRFVFLPALLIALFLLRNDLRESFKALASIQMPLESRFDRFLAGFIVLSLCLSLLFALTPPVAWDAQTYHLVEGKLAIGQGRISAPPNIPYFSFPSLVEMLFLAGMILKGDTAAQTIHWLFLSLTLGGVLAFAARYFTHRIGLLAAALLVAAPSFLTVATWAYVDLALVSYTFASFYALTIALQAGGWRWYALAGAFAGFAMGVKYTGAIIPLALFGVLLVARPARPWVMVLIHWAFTALVAAPWYLRNLVFTGNPIYPFFFGGPNWDSFRAEWFGRFGTGLLTSSPWQLLLAPWDATVLGREGALGYEATVGPLLLALIPLLLLLRQRADGERDSAPVLGYVLLFAAVLYVFWLAGIAGSKLLQQTRLVYPAFPALALAGAFAFDRLSTLDLRQFSIQRFTRLVLLLVLSLTLVSYLIAFASSNPLAYLSGLESRAHFIDKSLGSYARAVYFINDELPRDTLILALWEPRSYYIDRPIQPDVILDKWAHLRWKFGNADQIASELKRQGYSVILLNRAGLDYQLQIGYDPLSEKDMQVLEEMLAGNFRQIYGDAPLQIGTSSKRMRVEGAADDPYAIYVLKTGGAD